MNKSFPTKRLQMTLTELRRVSERTLIVRLRFADGESFMYRPRPVRRPGGGGWPPRHFSIANAVPIEIRSNYTSTEYPAEPSPATVRDARARRPTMDGGPIRRLHIPPEAPTGIILVAGGTGFAPLRACLEQLAAADEARPAPVRTIHLYWALAPWRTSMIASIWRSRRQLPGLHFVRRPGPGHPNVSARTGLVHRAMIEDFADLSGPTSSPAAASDDRGLANDCAAERGFNASRLTADIFVAGPVCEAITPPTEGAAIELA